MSLHIFEIFRIVRDPVLVLCVCVQCMGDSSKPGVIERSVRVLLKLSAKISAKVLAGSNTFMLLSKVGVHVPHTTHRARQQSPVIVLFCCIAILYIPATYGDEPLHHC